MHGSNYSDGDFDPDTADELESSYNESSDEEEQASLGRMSTMINASQFRVISKRPEPFLETISASDDDFDNTSTNQLGASLASKRRSLHPAQFETPIHTEDENPVFNTSSTPTFTRVSNRPQSAYSVDSSNVMRPSHYMNSANHFGVSPPLSPTQESSPFSTKPIISLQMPIPPPFPRKPPAVPTSPVPRSSLTSRHSTHSDSPTNSFRRSLPTIVPPPLPRTSLPSRLHSPVPSRPPPPIPTSRPQRPSSSRISTEIASPLSEKITSPMNNSPIDHSVFDIGSHTPHSFSNRLSSPLTISDSDSHDPVLVTPVISPVGINRQTNDVIKQDAVELNEYSQPMFCKDNISSGCIDPIEIEDVNNYIPEVSSEGELDPIVADPTSMNGFKPSFEQGNGTSDSEVIPINENDIQGRFSGVDQLKKVGIVTEESMAIPRDLTETTMVPEASVAIHEMTDSDMDPEESVAIPRGLTETAMAPEESMAIPQDLQNSVFIPPSLGLSAIASEESVAIPQVLTETAMAPEESMAIPRDLTETVMAPEESLAIHEMTDSDMDPEEHVAIPQDLTETAMAPEESMAIPQTNEPVIDIGINPLPFSMIRSTDSFDPNEEVELKLQTEPSFTNQQSITIEGDDLSYGSDALPVEKATPLPIMKSPEGIPRDMITSTNDYDPEEPIELLQPIKKENDVAFTNQENKFEPSSMVIDQINEDMLVAIPDSGTISDGELDPEEQPEPVHTFRPFMASSIPRNVKVVDYQDYRNSMGSSRNFRDTLDSNGRVSIYSTNDMSTSRPFEGRASRISILPQPLNNTTRSSIVEKPVNPSLSKKMDNPSIFRKPSNQMEDEGNYANNGLPTFTAVFQRNPVFNELDEPSVLTETTVNQRIISVQNEVVLGGEIQEEEKHETNSNMGGIEFIKDPTPTPIQESSDTSIKRKSNTKPLPPLDDDISRELEIAGAESEEEPDIVEEPRRGCFGCRH